MKLVLDANPLFSALIKNSFTANIITDNNIELFAPEFLLEEFLKHKKEILDKTKRTEKELNDLVKSLKDIINVVPEKEFAMFLHTAEKITPDEDDIP